MSKRKEWELSEDELLELQDGYKDVALAEITMRVSQKKLWGYIICNIPINCKATTRLETDKIQELVNSFKF